MTPYAEYRYPLRLSTGPGRIHAAAESQSRAEPYRFRVVTACGLDITDKPQEAHGIGPTCKGCKRQ
jgi:hypothetical protein